MCTYFVYFKSKKELHLMEFFLRYANRNDYDLRIRIYTPRSLGDL